MGVEAELLLIPAEGVVGNFSILFFLLRRYPHNPVPPPPLPLVSLRPPLFLLSLFRGLELEALLGLGLVLNSLMYRLRLRLMTLMMDRED